MSDASGRAVEPTAVQARLEALARPGPMPETRLSRALDDFVRRVGEAVSWIWPVLLAVVVGNVVLRYVFGEGRIELEELQWHLYSVGFLVGLSYCVESDDHIRVDFLHARFSPRLQAWIELYGILLLQLPFVLLVLLYTAPFVAHAFERGEVSSAPGGLPWRWGIKAMLFAGFALLLVATVSRLLRVGSALFSFPAALPARTGVGAEKNS